MAAPGQQQGALEQAANKVWAQITGWAKKFIQLSVLVLILVTIAEFYGINWFNIRTLALTQEACIGMAGMGFLYSKL